MSQTPITLRWIVQAVLNAGKFVYEGSKAFAEYEVIPTFSPGFSKRFMDSMTSLINISTVEGIDSDSRCT
jgi:hypothetical protein